MLHSNLEHWNLLVHPTESQIAREFQVTNPVANTLPLVTLPGCGIPATAMKLLSAQLPPSNLGLGGRNNTSGPDGEGSSNEAAADRAQLITAP